MGKLKMWWCLKGEDKTKKIIGRACRWLGVVCIGLFVSSAIIYAIIEYGWLVVVSSLGAVILFCFIVYAAISWGDK